MPRGQNTFLHSVEVFDDFIYLLRAVDVVADNDLGGRYFSKLTGKGWFVVILLIATILRLSG